jgi:hypothetical protein
MSFHDLLVFRVWVEKSVIPMGLPLYMACLLSFVPFRILSLFCVLSVLIMMCLGVFLFWFWQFIILLCPILNVELVFLWLTCYSSFCNTLWDIVICKYFLPCILDFLLSLFFYGSLRLEYFEFQTSLVYLESSRTTWDA